MINVMNATQTHNKQVIFHDVNFSINQGERVAIVGRNGAGKTTLLHSILGFSRLKKGKIMINGKPAHRHRDRNGDVSYLPEKFQLYLQLTVRENVQYFADMLKMEEAELERVLRLTEMWDDQNKRITQLSKGMLQRVGLSIVLLGNPKLIILDEPTSGLDPFGQADILHIMEKVGINDRTILFTTHNMNEVSELATHVLYLHNQQAEKMKKEKFLDLGVPGTSRNLLNFV